jgi:hypothetical protein
MIFTITNVSRETIDNYLIETRQRSGFPKSVPNSADRVTSEIEVRKFGRLPQHDLVQGQNDGSSGTGRHFVLKILK